jgi:N-acetylglucosaminyl-diphospho-decaprenol L-rhamnosyltransferase
VTEPPWVPPNSVDNVLDVVVVNHESAVPLERCLETLRADGAARIVVVDNASTDDSAKVAARFGAEWLPTGSNLGFGRAVNRGVAATSSPFVLVLNPDAEVQPGCLRELVVQLQKRPSLGVVGPRVLNPDGTEYPSARAFPSFGIAVAHAFVGLVAPRNRWSRQYRHPEAVEWVSGTAMAVRRTAIEQVGGFDEAYFMYMEDVDLCRRLTDASWQVGLAPDAVVVHSIGASSERHPYRMIAAHHASMWRYIRGATTGWRRATLLVVGPGIVVRMVLAWAQRVVRRRPHAAP